MCLTLPRTRITVTGIEKWLPRGGTLTCSSNCRPARPPASERIRTRRCGPARRRGRTSTWSCSTTDAPPRSPTARPQRAVLHPLLRVPEPVPGVRAHGRPCVRVGLCRSNRCRPIAAAHPSGHQPDAAVRVVAVRRVLRRVPSRHRQSRADAPACRVVDARGRTPEAAGDDRRRAWTMRSPRRRTRALRLGRFARLLRGRRAQPPLSSWTQSRERCCCVDETKHVLTWRHRRTRRVRLTDVLQPWCAGALPKPTCGPGTRRLSAGRLTSRIGHGWTRSSANRRRFSRAIRTSVPGYSTGSKPTIRRSRRPEAFAHLAHTGVRRRRPDSRSIGPSTTLSAGSAQRMQRSPGRGSAAAGR